MHVHKLKFLLKFFPTGKYEIRKEDLDTLQFSSSMGNHHFIFFICVRTLYFSLFIDTEGLYLFYLHTIENKITFYENFGA